MKFGKLAIHRKCDSPNLIMYMPKHIFYIFFVLFRLTEDQWVTHETRLPVTRELMMVALQNVQRIFIRATGKIIHDYSMEM